MSIPQQTVDDPRSLLVAPSGWTEIYSASYAHIADEPAGTQISATALEFYGLDIGALEFFGPDQIRGLAPNIDHAAISLLATRQANVYGTKVFHVVQFGITLPIIGNINVDRYRYVFAHRAVS